MFDGLQDEIDTLVKDIRQSENPAAVVEGLGMISNTARTTVISSLGWVDHDSLWHFDVSSSRNTPIPLETGAQWTSLHYSGTDRFSAAHHFDGSRFEMT